jgi:hypothetical protein
MVYGVNGRTDQPRARAGDADRNRYADHISEVFSLGYIDDEERVKLIDATQRAKYQDELCALLTGLPPLPQSLPPVLPPSPAEVEYATTLSAWRVNRRKMHRRHAIAGAIGVLLAAGVPVWDSSTFDGFAHGGPWVTTLNILAIIFGIVLIITTVIAYFCWLDAADKMPE